MKQIIPEDSRYIPMTQQPFCCVPACISMIMYKHKIPLIPQELLGHHLGLFVPKQKSNLFWNVQIGKRSKKFGYGTRINKKEFDINNVFKKLNIPLKVNFVKLKAFKNHDEYLNYLASVVSNDKDVLIFFDWGILYDRDFHSAHLAIIDKVDIKNNEVRLIDPEFVAPKWSLVKIDKLKQAQEYFGVRAKGNFWEFIPV